MDTKELNSRIFCELYLHLNCAKRFYIRWKEARLGNPERDRLY